LDELLPELISRGAWLGSIALDSREHSDPVPCDFDLQTAHSTGWPTL